MIKWAKELEQTAKKSPKRIHRNYMEEEKQHAIVLYFENDCNLKKTVRESGYGSATGRCSELCQNESFSRHWKR